jgi:hypothetical protein
VVSRCAIVLIAARGFVPKADAIVSTPANHPLHLTAGDACGVMSWLSSPAAGERERYADRVRMVNKPR